jgi:transcriptional regulator with XRE-family HTH domain
MRALLHTEFTALLARAGVSQAAFARLSGVTPRQVNKWARGHAAVPRWAALLAVVLEDTTAEALLLMLDDTQLSPNQVLGV